MNRWLLLTALTLPLASGPRAEPPACAYENWAAEEKAFADRLGSLVDSDVTTVEELNRQVLLGRTADLKIPPPPALPESSTPAEVYRRCRPGVVAFGSAFKCGKCDHWHVKVASGFVLRADGVIATNFHVVEKSDDTRVLGVRLEDGTVYPVKEVLASDRANDVAIVKIAAEDLTPLPLGSEPEIGDPVLVIGHPVGAFYTLSSGLVGNKFRRGRRQGAVEEFSITADFAKGSSGGPVLNARGEVVGMVRATHSVYYEKDQNLQMVWKYVIPAAALRERLGNPAAPASP